MPDIAMCKNDNCPLKDSCYRFKATPDSYQAYTIVEKEEYEDGNCPIYIRDEFIIS
jgi:hypothetical protein